MTKKFAIKWSIVKRAQAYTPGGSHCKQCTEENYRSSVEGPTEQTKRTVFEMLPSKQIQRVQFQAHAKRVSNEPL